MTVTRRSLLKFGAFGIGATAAGLTIPLGQAASTSDWISTSAKPARYQRKLPVPQPVDPEWIVEDGVRYAHYTVTEAVKEVQILDSGAPKTPVIGYALGTDRNNVTVPGPLISVDQNTPVKLTVRNQVGNHPVWSYPVKTSVHLHGSASLPQYDGYADDVTGNNQSKDYYYPNHQGARTLWYHDHGVHHTAQNAYSGLVAQYHLHTPWERDKLPQGDRDIPLIISDAMFGKDGKLAYNDRSHSGLYGDVIMVNGVPWPFLPVERYEYRFRVLAATLSRSFNLRFYNTTAKKQLPVYIVASDGGLLKKPVSVTSWQQAGAERYEVIVDFRQCNPGDMVELLNSSNKNNVDYLHTGKIMQFRVGGAVQVSTTPVAPAPAVPPTPPEYELHDVLKVDHTQMRLRTRNIDLEHDDVTNEFMINGMTWQDVQDGHYNVFSDSSGDAPKVGDYEIWRIENKSGGWFHPLHIHLVDFKVIRRSGGRGKVMPWELNAPKDVVYVGEGEIVDVLVKYDTAPAKYSNGNSSGKAGATGELGGRYMIHCHNLPHEDHDMMGQFFVAPKAGVSVPGDPMSDGFVNHPVYAAPAKP